MGVGLGNFVGVNVCSHIIHGVGVVLPLGVGVGIRVGEGVSVDLGVGVGVGVEGLVIGGVGSGVFIMVGTQLSVEPGA